MCIRDRDSGWQVAQGSFGNTTLLDKEAQEDLGSIGKVDVFPVGPEQVIRLVSDSRRRRNLSEESNFHSVCS